MSDINDGGPAFPPHPCPACGSDHAPAHDPGMSLRDYFAGQAIAALLDWDAEDVANMTGALGLKWNDDLTTSRAEIAYRQADAMIAARGGSR